MSSVVSGGGEVKIALYIAHEGLLRMFIDLWEDHEVRMFPEWYKRGELGIPLVCGDEDVIVSTVPHMELNWLNTEKPMIAYMTNPVYHEAQPGFGFWYGKKNFYVVGSEDCYPPELIIPFTIRIPYAMKDYPIYNGRINKVLIVNRKPDNRLIEITRGAISDEHNVARMMGNLPYTIAQEPDKEKFKQMYADHKVLFYYSPAPYTIVMYEAMTVGMPMVAFNHATGSYACVIEMFLPNRSTNPDEIRRMLKEELDRTLPCSPIDYGNPSFGEIKQMWNDLFEVIM